jgi:adenine-specific DNA-methyltransferase
MWFYKDVGHTQEAKKELLKYVSFQNNENVLNSVKPTRLIERILQIATTPEGNDVVLDFFAGSAPTAHAVMKQNRCDGGNRRFICIQIPEPLPTPESKMSTIFEMGLQRLRSVGQESRDNGEDRLEILTPTDFGFRIFRLDSSNIRPWDADRENLDKALLDSMDHVKPERGDTDVLYELLLKRGLDLCVPIEQRAIADKVVHSVGTGALIVCLATRISREDVEPLASGIIEWHKEQNPAGESTVVFRDHAFVDDVAKTNLAAILHQHGLENVRSL